MILEGVVTVIVLELRHCLLLMLEILQNFEIYRRWNLRPLGFHGYQQNLSLGFESSHESGRLAAIELACQSWAVAEWSLAVSATIPPSSLLISSNGFKSFVRSVSKSRIDGGVVGAGDGVRGGDTAMPWLAGMMECVVCTLEVREVPASRVDEAMSSSLEVAASSLAVSLVSTASLDISIVRS